MLNDSQQLTVRVAIRRARENGTEAEEIKKLAAGMHVSEAEIRACTDSALGTAPAKRRVVWTSEMVERLTVLHDQGMGPAAIAKQMGMKPSQVQFKLSNLKLKTQASEDPAPAAALAPPAGEPLPADQPEEPADPAEPTAVQVRVDSEERQRDSEPPPGPEPMKQIRQAAESIKQAFSVFSVPNDIPDDEGEDSETLIDMPAALLYLMKLVHEHYGDNVIRVHASNDEHYAACAFAVDGIEYDLKLEVLGE
jgi:hypothetical protein